MTGHQTGDGAALPARRDGRVLPAAAPSSEWLGHRDLCPLQWHQPCTCPGGPELLAEQEASSGLQEVSLFSGIGGISRGLELAGARTVLLCEQDKHARKILGRHYPDAAIHNDVTELTADDCRSAGAVPGRTVLTAGWPCQGNSVAGRRGGMDDPRSGLWSHVVRLLADLRPAWFIGENVPGLLSVNDGRDFSVVVHDLARLGYGCCWRVLDARHFGVPQRRRRVVIVGRLGGTGAAPAQVLLEPEGLLGDPAQGITPRPSVARDARAGAGFRGWASELAPTLEAGANSTGGTRPPGTTVDTAESLVVGTLTARYGKGTDSDATDALVYVADAITALDTAQGGPDDNTAQGGQLVAFAENQRGELVTSSTMPALKVGGGKPGQGYPAVSDGTIVRRLTPLECERLQGFPDGWTDNGQADTQRYKQLGNSVAVPVFEWVGRRLVAVDNQLTLTHGGTP